MGEGYIKFKFDPGYRPENGQCLVHLSIIFGAVALGILFSRFGLRGGFGVVLGTMYASYWILPSSWTGTDKVKERPKIIGVLIGALIYLVGANLLFPKT